MATGDRYVQISREELEEWLRRNFGRDWSRDQKYAGIYLVHLSDSVAVKLSSSIGATSQVRGLGKASMKLTLVSRITGRVLNAKAKDRKSFMRTKGWKKTWLAGVRHWEGVYQKYPDFYDRIGRGEEAEPKQQESGDSGSSPSSDGVFLGRLRQLWLAAKAANDSYVQRFAEDVGKRAKTRQPSDKQIAFAEKMFRKYDIPEQPQRQSAKTDYDAMAIRLEVRRRSYTDKQMDELEKIHQDHSDGSFALLGKTLESVWESSQPGYEPPDEDPDYDIPYEAKYGPRDDHWASNVILKHAARKVASRYRGRRWP